MKQFTKVGLEYGMLKNVPVENTMGGIISVSIDSYKLFELLNKTHPKTWMKVYHDDGCVECVTLPLKYEEALTTHEHLNKLSFLKWNDEVEMSGGLHVNLDNINIKNLRWLILDTSNKPYLNWCFNEAIDSENANSLLTEKINVVSDPWSYHYKKINAFEYVRTRESLPDHQNWCITQNQFFRRGRYVKYIEYRLFDNPHSYEEFKTFVDIAIAMRLRAINADVTTMPTADHSSLKVSKTEALKRTIDFVENTLNIPIPPSVKKIWKTRLYMRYDIHNTKKRQKLT